MFESYLLEPDKIGGIGVLIFSKEKDRYIELGRFFSKNSSQTLLSSFKFDKNGLNQLERALWFLSRFNQKILLITIGEGSMILDKFLVKSNIVDMMVCFNPNAFRYTFQKVFYICTYINEINDHQEPSMNVILGADIQKFSNNNPQNAKLRDELLRILNYI